jgi:Bifunctional DNA primase/polymerase, N-terminal
MIVNRGWVDSLAMAEGYGLGGFVILHGIDRYRRERERSASGAGARPTTGWGLEHQSDHGERAPMTSAPRRCCACKRGRACPDPGKHPRVLKGQQEHGHLDAMDAETLLYLIDGLGVRPINLGIVPAPDMIVVDVDPRNGGDATLRSLEARYGPLPVTLGVYTGGGGEHRWYRAQPGIHRKAAIGPGVDLKTGAVGGLLVAPPSVHLSGRRYHWTNRRLPPADAPTWLDEITRHREATTAGAGSRAASGPAQPGVIAGQMAKAAVGERAVTLFRLACWCLETDDDLIGLRLAARSTGLTEHKIEAQIRSARRKVGR